MAPIPRFNRRTRTRCILAATLAIVLLFLHHAATSSSNSPFRPSQVIISVQSDSSDPSDPPDPTLSDHSANRIPATATATSASSAHFTPPTPLAPPVSSSTLKGPGPGGEKWVIAKHRVPVDPTDARRENDIADMRARAVPRPPLTQNPELDALISELPPPHDAQLYTDTVAPKCLPHIVYDKPVKTGSTAVKFAIVDYLSARRGNHSNDGCDETDSPCTFAPCSYSECNDFAERFLAGDEPKRSILGHMFGQEGLINRLGQAGYYKVTSIRSPAERWHSMYRFNQAMKGTHYGISYKASYEEFMTRMGNKSCSLLHYYDRGGPKCGHKLMERVAKVVARYDEIVDLYDEPVGQLEKLIAPYVVVENKSPDMHVPDGFDLDSLLVNEVMLYNAFRARRMELAGREANICREVE